MLITSFPAHCVVKAEDPNYGWPRETHLIWPVLGLMSKKAQQEDIQIVSDRATENLNGLYLFQNGMPTKTEKKEM